jgi:hypothetical protein
VTGRWTGRGLRMIRRVWSVATADWHGTLGLRTGASGRSWDRRVRSSPRETAKHARSIGCGGVFGHDRPDTSSRVVELTGIDRTLALWHPVSSSSASGRVVSNANQGRPGAEARPISLIGASDHSSA